MICFTEVRIHHRVNPSLCWCFSYRSRVAFIPFPDPLEGFFRCGGKARSSQTFPQLTTPWELMDDT
jgi:hypothetical protein